MIKSPHLVFRAYEIQTSETDTGAHFHRPARACESRSMSVYFVKRLFRLSRAISWDLALWSRRDFSGSVSLLEGTYLDEMLKKLRRYSMSGTDVYSVTAGHHGEIGIPQVVRGALIVPKVPSYSFRPCTLLLLPKSRSRTLV